MKQLSASDLRWCHDPAAIELPQEAAARLDGLVGQGRASDAIRLSATITHAQFNLFVTGPAGTGRTAEVQRILMAEAARRPAPSDWVYVNNFDAPHKPIALELPPGKAMRLRDYMSKLVDDLASDIPALFESEEYQTQRRMIEEEAEQAHESAMADFGEKAAAEQVAILRTPMGYMLTAIRDGKSLKREDYEKLPEAEREEIDEKISRLQEDLADVMREAPKLAKQGRTRVEQLNADLAERAVQARFDDVPADLHDIEPVAEYLDAVRDDIIDNAELFLKPEEDGADGPFPATTQKMHASPRFGRYAVNVMLTSDPNVEPGAPVEQEDLPTLDRLTGRIEHVSHMGSLLTNFTMIKPGALHRANGGYLILDARRVLSEPYAWDALKRCLKNSCITITSLAERVSLASTVTLEPDPIPLSVRVVLIGDRLVHALLVVLDPDFAEHFKVQADFEETVDRDADSLKGMVSLLAGRAVQEARHDMNAGGMARLLDEAVRLADDTRKFSLQIEALTDLLCEADHYAAERGSAEIDAADIDRAIEEGERRASRVKDRMQEAIERGTILIDTSGSTVGQVNGLSVLGLGGFMFGRPSRITARVRVGAGKLIDIEREVELGGPLHSKGVMILSGYLASSYARDVPFSLHASLVFEQSYGNIDGDSASSAELYALLSALAGVPIDQGLAVTGSVNQAGEVQAIGGVNQKIEGFFDVCRTRGLTGTQGVLIPAANTEHLMLRRPVVEAVEAGQFRILAVETIAEGIEALTGIPAGVRGRDGAFEDGSINARVEATLRQFAEQRRDFARNPRGDDVGGAS